MFSQDELLGLKDLARIAETELRAHAAASLQKTLLMRLDLAQRRHALDAATGCWSIRGFRELLGMAVPQARAENTQLALVHLAVNDVDGIASVLGEAGRTSVLSVLAQLLRERLPPDGALARLGESEFCALVPAPTAASLEQLLAPMVDPGVLGVLPDGRELRTGVTPRVVRLSDLDRDASASRFWAASLAGHAG